MRKIKLGFISALVLIAGAFLGFTAVAYANPSQFTNTTQTSSSTTTPSYLTAGTATTTVVADTYQVSTGNNYVNDMTTLLVQFTASSTSSQLNVNMEYSNGYPGVDCVATPTACDWYQDSGMNMQGYATSSVIINLALVPQYQWKFASSTVGQLANGANNNRDTRALLIKVPTRYIRAVFTCAIGGTPCAEWSQFVPAKQVR